MLAASPTRVPLGRRIVPPLCVSLLTLLHLSRLPVIEWLAASPALDLIALYYWTMARPNRLPMWLLFILGLVVDSLSNTPLGIHAALYLAGFGLARFVRARLEAFSLLPMWGIFSLWLLLLQLAEWMLAGWQLQALPPAGLLPLQWLLTLIVYPPLHLLFDRVLTYGQRWRL